MKSILDLINKIWQIFKIRMCIFMLINLNMVYFQQNMNQMHLKKSSYK